MVLEAHRASDILAALAFAPTNRIRLVILGGTETWRVADELAKAHVPVILTPSEASPWEFEALGARDDAAALLDRAGVPLILSSGGWTHNVRRIRQGRASPWRTGCRTPRRSEPSRRAQPSTAWLS